MKHMIRVSELSYLFAEYLGIENKDEVKISARLHDIGKAYINPRILNKPSKLDAEEFRQIKYHPFFSAYDSIEKGCSMEIAINILFHHENYDGTGYFVLKGDDIPLVSRIIKIADVYDALTSERPYRQKLSTMEALNIMVKNSREYDPKLFKEFKEYILDKIDGYSYLNKIV